MNGGSGNEDESRRLSPLGATVLVLLALFLEVVAWLWIAGPPQELAVTQPSRVTVHLAPLPPPVPPPTPQPTAAPEAPPTSASPPAQPEAPAAPAAAAPETPAAAAPPPAEAPATAPPAAPPLPGEPVPGGKPMGKSGAAGAPQLALVPAPAPSVVERSKIPPPPRAVPELRPPWRVYARPFDKHDSRPRIAVVIGNLGLSSAATEAAIQELPGGVTLAFSPYAHGLADYISLARAAGHEVLLSLPMATEEASAKRAGPQALLATVSGSENLDRLSWLLSRFTGYVGALNDSGPRAAGDDVEMLPILAELKDHGLLFLDSHTASGGLDAHIALQLGLPAATSERIIDTEASRAAIDQMLEAVEEEARQKGTSIAMGFPYPVTIERVAAWTATLPEKGISLAPVSAMVRARSGS